MSYYIHNIPGRLRIRIPSVKKRDNKNNEIQKLFWSLDGIDRVSVNKTTGSVVVKYDSKMVQADHIIEIFMKNNYLDTSRSIINDNYFMSDGNSQTNSSFYKTTSKAGNALGKAVVGWAVEKALEPTGFSFVAAFI
ncbi:Heavy-metal-associated domain-containing protein [Candidatus Magnetomoraceae bacterium gMMP-15]